jgi:flagellar motor component MotA
MAAGIGLITAAIFRLHLLEEAEDSSELAIALGGAMVALSVLSIAAYGVIRAIEWANRP